MLTIAQRVLCKLAADRAKERQKMNEVHDLLGEIEAASFTISICVHDHNGELGNGWKADLGRANHESSRIYWMVEKIRCILKASACQRELDAFGGREGSGDTGARQKALTNTLKTPGSWTEGSSK
jgi:hypothetical protein